MLTKEAAADNNAFSCLLRVYRIHSVVQILYHDWYIAVQILYHNSYIRIRLLTWLYAILYDGHTICWINMLKYVLSLSFACHSAYKSASQLSVKSWFLILYGNMSRYFHLARGNSEKIQPSGNGLNYIKPAISLPLQVALGHRRV